MQQPPPDWAKDGLSSFIDHALENSFATFHNKKKEYSTLSSIDDWFTEIVTNLNNRPELAEVMLFTRAHSTYRAAARLAISGQCPEVYSLLRTAIECSLYALRMYGTDELAEVWLNRHEDDASLKKVRNEFSYKNVILNLDRKDKKLAKSIDTLYQRCIDYGAHPNERAVIANMKINKLDKAKEYLQVYLAGNGDTLDLALKTCAQAGVGILYIFRFIYKERFDLLELTPKMDRLKSQL